MPAPGSADPFGTGPFQCAAACAAVCAGRGRAAVGRRAVLAVLVAWVPLVVLAQLQGLAIGTGQRVRAAGFRGVRPLPRGGSPAGARGGPDPHLAATACWTTSWMRDSIPPERGCALHDAARLDPPAPVSRLALAGNRCPGVHADASRRARRGMAQGAALWTLSLERDGQQVVSYAGWWRLLVSQPLFHVAAAHLVLAALPLGALHAAHCAAWMCGSSPPIRTTPADWDSWGSRCGGSRFWPSRSAVPLPGRWPTW